MNKGSDFTCLNEQRLIEGCKRGIPADQKVLYHRYGRTLMLLCQRYADSREDAEEILADAFVTAFGKISSFEYRGEGSLQAWLKRIAVNQCLMRMRKSNIRFEELGVDVTEPTDQSVLEQMGAREIMLLIHNLPPGYRTIFNLYVFEEMTHKEIASMLQISENTSKSQLHKARQLLQKQLSGKKQNDYASKQ